MIITPTYVKSIKFVSTISLREIKCDKEYYLESPLKPALDDFGDGSINSPYKGIGALKKELIQMSSSHKLFNYSQIWLTFYLK